MSKKTKSALRLVENAFLMLPLGSMRPAEWLHTQLRIQANGLTGHLDEFWPDIADSAWIGGKGEGWEHGPYWLDGLVPLAFPLDNERLKQKAQDWIASILSHQQEVRTPDDGLGALVYAPCIVTTDIAGVSARIEVMTTYPFEEDIHLSITTDRPVHFPLLLHIPG